MNESGAPGQAVRPHLQRVQNLIYPLLLVAQLSAWSCRDQAPSASTVSSAATATAAVPSPATDGNARPSTPSGVAQQPTTDNAQPTLAPSVTPQTVRALVGTWVTAQNELNFDTYASHYAERFTGTKRASERVAYFDRKS